MAERSGTCSGRAETPCSVGTEPGPLPLLARARWKRLICNQPEEASAEMETISSTPLAPSVEHSIAEVQAQNNELAHIDMDIFEEEVRIANQAASLPCWKRTVVYGRRGRSDGRDGAMPECFAGTTSAAHERAYELHIAPSDSQQLHPHKSDAGIGLRGDVGQGYGHRPTSPVGAFHSRTPEALGAVR